MNTSNHQHPPSLGVFFATEMWERYGFYVVQSLLALYMAMHFQWDDTSVYALVGSFTALTYLSPVVGGWIADNLTGQKRAILLGAIWLLFSYVALSQTTGKWGLVASLAGIAVGTGLLKPNISSLLGNEYPPDSPKRESGFTIFYMGITTGIILGTTLPSILNARYGWPVSFLSAAFGMILAIAVFSFGLWRYRIADYHPADLTPTRLSKTILILASLWLGATAVLSQPWLANGVFGGLVLVSLAYIVQTVRRESEAQSRQTLVIGLLCCISVMFWAFYFQMFLSLTLCIARIAKPTLFGVDFPPPYYVAIQSIGMILAGIVLARRVNAPGLVERGIKAGNKFLLAMLCMCVSYGLIAVTCSGSVSVALLSPLLFIPAYLIISVAELLLSPTGLSAVTFLASRKKVSTMMGIFFVSLGIGGFLSGKLASIAAIPEGSLTVMALKAHYGHAFLILFAILLLCTMVAIGINRLIQHLLKTSPCARG